VYAAANAVGPGRALGRLPEAQKTKPILTRWGDVARSRRSAPRRPGPTLIRSPRMSILRCDIPAWSADPQNPFTQEPLRNEPTPGNMTLRETDQGPEVVIYDIDAVPHAVPPFDP